ncbi:histone-lysine N-methyltransferase SETMAR-like [Apis dorsata]|uniref:histone-lysine N-methyltransferase SETMAR-like n=1 Tax=Apis dorsata TaxID=7462 RepID=UPI001293C8C1|nr:histone-lysine N-methyltransferase SETMAR-like [Apis dorsata]
MKVPFATLNQKKHLRHIVLYCFKKGDSANNIADEICTIYESGATTITIIRNWFKRFRTDNFDLKDEDRSGHPAMMNIDFIKAIFAENPRYNVQKIVDAINISRKTIDNHNQLTKMGYINQCEI